MGILFSTILTALLIVPLHTLSYVKTFLHITQHSVEPDEKALHDNPGHSHDHEDYDPKHEHEADHSPSGSAPDLSHRHAPNQATHNHDRDIWGLFSNPGVCLPVTLTSLPVFVFMGQPVFEVDLPISKAFLGSLLRPPIA